jgi:hypothetical protein
MTFWFLSNQSMGVRASKKRQECVTSLVDIQAAPGESCSQSVMVSEVECLKEFFAVLPVLILPSQTAVTTDLAAQRQKRSLRQGKHLYHYTEQKVHLSTNTSLLPARFLLIKLNISALIGYVIYFQLKVI